jgi:hypothetical protein
MKQLQPRQNQKGVALFLVLGVLALISLATWLLSSRSDGGTSNIASATANGTATAVIGQANAIYGGFQQAAVNGVSPMTATLDNTATGIFNPTVGGAVQPAVLNRAIVGDAAASWAKASVTMPGIGSEAGADVLAYLANVKQDVCAAIVKSFKNTSTIPSVSASSALLDGADLSTFPDMTSQTTGCFQAFDDGKYVAYTVVGAY